MINQYIELLTELSKLLHWHLSSSQEVPLTFPWGFVVTLHSFSLLSISRGRQGNYSRKRPAPVTDTFSRSEGIHLFESHTVQLKHQLQPPSFQSNKIDFSFSFHPSLWLTKMKILDVGDTETALTSVYRKRYLQVLNRLLTTVLFFTNSSRSTPTGKIALTHTGKTGNFEIK